MDTFCQFQEDAEGCWAFHIPFSAPRERSGMCVFLLFGEELAFAHHALFFRGGERKVVEIYMLERSRPLCIFPWRFLF